MTSREIVKRTIKFQNPERLAIDLGFQFMREFIF